MRIQNYINGDLFDPSTREWIDNINPANKEKIGEIPNSNSEDVRRAVEAAENAFPLWSKTPVTERSKILRRISDMILDNLDELALV